MCTVWECEELQTETGCEVMVLRNLLNLNTGSLCYQCVPEISVMASCSVKAATDNKGVWLCSSKDLQNGPQGCLACGPHLVSWSAPKV